MRMNFRFTLLLLIVVLLPCFVYSHGVEGTVEAGGLTVTAIYDSGEPISYGAVSIAAPGAELPFQSGRTDRNGRFCFFPDGAGEWTVVVDDEIGHRLALNVPVDEVLAVNKDVDTPGGLRHGSQKTTKAALGISLIGNMTLGVLLVRRRKTKRK